MIKIVRRSTNVTVLLNSGATVTMVKKSSIIEVTVRTNV